MTDTQTAPLPGQYFDIPGVPGGSTQWTEQYEPAQYITTTLAQGAQVQVTNYGFFRQTDVVVDWIFDCYWAQTYAVGTGQTLANSVYGPFNLIGPFQLLIQNQYASCDVENGIDLYIFNLLRPWMGDVAQTNQYANPSGDPMASTATGYYQASLAQVNLIAGSTAWSNSVSQAHFILRIPAAQPFHSYFDLAVTGEPTMGWNPMLPGAGGPALVSPQYMAGTTRNISPNLKFNQLLGTNVSDIAPVTTTANTPTTDSASTASGTATTTWRRRAIYAGNPAVLPPVWAWQYRWKTYRLTLGAVTIPPPIQLSLDSGQILMTYIRLFDPGASTPAPININTITKCQLQYGSGLLWFDDTNPQTATQQVGPYELQRRFFDQHGFLPPQGVLVFDLMQTERGIYTNARALNTLTTAGIQIALTFVSAPSASAYVVNGIESLVYVS